MWYCCDAWEGRLLCVALFTTDSCIFICFLVCLVCLVCYGMTRWNGNYTKYGELTVHKSEEGMSIDSSGALEVLDTSGPLIWLKFDESDVYELKDRQIVGLKYDQYQVTLSGNSTTIRNMTSTQGLQNYGSFGRKCMLSIALFVVDYRCSFLTFVV